METVIVNRVAKELLLLAKDVMADWGDATLNDLAGGTEFVPNFHGGKSFVVTHNGIYVRGPYGSENFRLIAIRHAVLELGLRGEDEAVSAFHDCGGNMNNLIRDLKATGKFGIWVI